jgi:hypothetical protein
MCLSVVTRVSTPFIFRLLDTSTLTKHIWKPPIMETHYHLMETHNHLMETHYHLWKPFLKKPGITIYGNLV